MKSSTKLLLFLFLLFNHFLYSQKSSVIGNLKDTRGPIPSAKVFIKDTPFKTLSDIDGNFVFKDVPAGDYILLVEYTGFSSLEKPFKLAKNEQLNLGSMSLNDVVDLNEVTIVRHAKTSENKALSLVKNSPSLVTVVSSDIIAKLPNKNASDVVA
ncbi:MAG: carboxypeptidase-like regulatory domain-containing protein, partial [Crocinitomicaceae bacterium]|nr:carboxypeptidase-like regulatory domain-containing protein [Crocinitomicaceae bacterium]